MCYEVGPKTPPLWKQMLKCYLVEYSSHNAVVDLYKTAKGSDFISVTFSLTCLVHNK